LRPQEATQITVAAATALWRAIFQVTRIQAEIKWPNDILIRGRKIAGILTEMSAEVDRVKHLVLGIGVDVNLTASELPADLRKIATSLRAELGKQILRAELATAILRELDHDYARVCGGHFADVADEWEERCTTIGQQVTITIGERKTRGRAETLDDDGALLVRTEHGHLERIIGGDVTLDK
jgi:BirA family biotin operon repressor/biotin-[acetyl-CoA-carboxylase] ligase